MPKLKVWVMTNKINSRTERIIEISEEDVQDEEVLEELANEAVNDMISSSYEVIED